MKKYSLAVTYIHIVFEGNTISKGIFAGKNSSTNESVKGLTRTLVIYKKKGQIMQFCETVRGPLFPMQGLTKDCLGCGTFIFKLLDCQRMQIKDVADRNDKLGENNFAV